MANDIKLQESHPVDENLRPLKVGGKSTAIETAQHGNGARINGDLEVTGDIKGNVKDVELDLTTITSTDLTIDDSGDITLDPHTGKVKIYDAGDTDDYLLIQTVGGSGQSKIQTVSADGDGHLSLISDGNIAVQAPGNTGNHVEFDGCAAGFDRLEATFSDTDVIESGGSHDTDIDFRLSNKWRLELSDDIAQMNLIFPNTSGNFLLVCHILAGGGGDFDVTAWKVWEYDSAAGSTNAAATTDVMWAGGSVPTFTSGAATDIVSFYWDADEQQAYGVASLAFATP